MLQYTTFIPPLPVPRLSSAAAAAWNCFAPEKLRARFPKSAARLGTTDAQWALPAADRVGRTERREGEEGNFIYSSLSPSLSVSLSLSLSNGVVTVVLRKAEGE